jgi:preprotein translocase subunit SecD
MNSTRILALSLLIAGIVLGYFVYASETQSEAWYYRPFRLGLDLSGGSHLVYEADASKVTPTEIRGAMDSLKEVIERRINVFGVSEPVIQVEQSGSGDNAKHRLIVELPGVTDLKKATDIISKTPTLEFKTERPDGPEKEALLKKWAELEAYKKIGVPAPANLTNLEDPYYVSTELTGKYLKRATVQFSQQAIAPTVSLEFNPQGGKLFADITAQNIGQTVAIYLDGVPISTPVVREAITSGQAEISGQFTVDEAKQLVRDLNLGALPVPISLVSTETIGATLGADALARGLKAGMIGILAVMIFMLFWYRLPGLVACVALSLYIIIMLAIFKLVPITLTTAGIAGFILSVGMAVDANILIFERMKEELKRGKHLSEAMHDGFDRAWLSIRDSNLSSIISAVILFWFGSSLIRGFALTLAVGVLISMLTAITITRSFLYSLGFTGRGRWIKALFNSGMR